MTSRARTLVVGLDAACWEYLDPLLQTGRLPNLAHLIGQGVCGTLRSTMPPITPTAWSSLVTGVNPGKHGVFEWVHREQGSYRFLPVSATDRVGTPIWSRLNAAGIRVGVANIPLTYPVQPVDGFLLCGFSAPDSARNLTYPPELMAEVEAGFGAYRPTVQSSLKDAQPHVLYAALREHQKRGAQIAATLARTQEVQVLITNLMLVDHTNHTMPTMGLVEQAMVDTDDDLGWLLAEFAPDNVLVISDHGSRRVRGVFLMGAWLAESGFLTRSPRPAAQRSQIINYVLLQWMNGRTRLPARAARFLLCHGLARLPKAMINPLWRAIERDIPLALTQVETLDRFVPTATRAFPVGANRGNLRLNLAGREPSGVVPSSESEAVLKQITEALRAISDPDSGEPLFSAVYRPGELYAGPFVDEAPDIVGDNYSSDWSVASALPGLHRRPWRFFLTDERLSYGDHSRDGIYVFSGRDFRCLEMRGRAGLLDIPATLLYLYDVPQPDDYDGGPLLEAFIASERPLRYQPGDERERGTASVGYAESEEMEVLERLSQLGYIS